MTHALRLLACWALKFSGVNALFRWRNRGKVLILWYHGVSQHEVRELMGYDERHVSREVFREHLRFLSAHGYQFITLDRYAEACRRKESLTRAVVLTFDDGFRNVLANAAPLMREFGAKGILYVVNECARDGRLLWTDQVELWVRGQQAASVELPLGGERVRYDLSHEGAKRKAMKDIKRRLRRLDDSERRREIERFYATHAVEGEFNIASFAELRAADQAVLEIGAHSMHHPNLTQLRSAEEFEMELQKSKAELEATLSRPIRHFAYPAGAFDARVVKEVERAGYTTAVTTLAGLNDTGADLLKLKRVGTNSSRLLFEAMSCGSYFAISKFFRTQRAES